MFASIVSYGLAVGAVYALIGITYNVMFSASRVFSFTAGTLGMLGGVLGSLFIAQMHLPLVVGFILVLAAGAIFGILKFEFPSHGGPAHTMAIPNKIGNYVRTVNLEKETNLGKLRSEVIQMSAGQASGVVSALYEAGDSAAGSTTQIIMVIEGHLANASPATSIGAFIAKNPGASVVPAGPLGGQAACVENGARTSNPVSLCVWFDNDSFGEILSPTMNAAQLATAMQTVRPAVELVAKK